LKKPAQAGFFVASRQMSHETQKALLGSGGFEKSTHVSVCLSAMLQSCCRDSRVQPEQVGEPTDLCALLKRWQDLP
jgi:hypothetical protein